MNRFWHTFGITIFGTAIGLAGALLARNATNFNQFSEELRSLVWMVVAIPLGTLLGGLAANLRHWTFTLGWVGVLYFLSVFVAARIERLMLGEQQASATKHVTYFTLIAIIQTLASIFFAWRLAVESTDDKGQRIEVK